MILPRFTWHLPKIPLVDPQAAGRVVQEELTSTMQAAVDLGERELKRLTPIGATGDLRGRIASEVRGTPAQIRGLVTTPMAYARPVEEGTPPGIWRPIGLLKLWARRILGDERAAYRVQWAIFRRGTKGQWMFRDAARVMYEPVRQLFRDANARLKRKLGG